MCIICLVHLDQRTWDTSINLTHLCGHLNVTDIILAASWENRIFAYAKTKAQISFAVLAKLISAFVFRYSDNTIPLLLLAKISSI